MGAPSGLPDVERLLAVPAAALRGLGERLVAIGLAAPFLARLARVGERLDDPWRAPMRIWNARRMKEPAAVVARLFMLHDVVEVREVEAALGDLGLLREAGLVEDAAGGASSRFHLAFAAGVHCFGDRPGAAGDAVLPVCGATVDLIRAALARDTIEAALDVGCGAGLVSLVFARSARRVVATDLSPRAVAFARANVALQGAPNVEVRCGDLFEPVRGQRFDRVASQPPFVALRAGATAVTFTHGGARGDELAQRLLSGVTPHLAPGGRAVVLADWPLVEGDPLDARLRRALGGASANLLVLQSPAKNLNEYCVQYAGVEHAELGEAFTQAAIAQRDHLESLGIRGIAIAVAVVEPATTADGWTSLLPVRHGADAPIHGAAVDRIAGARRLAHAGAEALRRACLRLPEGARVVEQPLPDGSPPAMVVQLPSTCPEWPVVIDAASAAIVREVSAAPTVFEAARAFAAASGTSIEAAWPRVEAAVRDALLRGALRDDANA